jgi:hypothetical protein
MSGAIRYNSSGYWEFSNSGTGASGTYKQFAAIGHTHLSAEISDATASSVSNVVVKRDALQASNFSAVYAGQSALTGEYLVLGAPTVATQTIDDALGANRSLVIRGSTSNFKVNIQDGVATVDLLWNASKAANGNYLVGSEPAADLSINTKSGYSTLSFLTAPLAAVAGGKVTWTSIFNTTDSKQFQVGPVGSPGVTLNPNGTALFTGQVTALSYETQSALALKDEVAEFKESALQMLNDIQVYSYKYKIDPKKETRIGIVADYVPNTLISGENHDHADIANLVGLLLKGLQELSSKVDHLTRAAD